MCVDWSTGTWSHEPAEARVERGSLHVTAIERSDAWRRTSYGFVHDSKHALLAPFQAENAVEVDFGGGFPRGSIRLA